MKESQADHQIKLFELLKNDDEMDQRRKEMWTRIRAKTSHLFSRRSLSINRYGQPNDKVK